MAKHHDNKVSDQAEHTVESLRLFFTDKKSPYWKIWSDGDPYPTLQRVKGFISDQRLEVTLILINQWVKWTATGVAPLLQELVARDISTKPGSVQYLTARLDKGLNWGTDLDVAIIFIYYAAIEAGDSRVKSRGLWDAQIPWDSFGDDYKSKAELMWQNGQLRVRRTIAQLLADMSEKPDNELERYARGPLGRILAKERDLEVRGSLVRILRNIGTDETIDAMMTAAIGEERRQDTLVSYYLEPSRERSRATENTVKGMVGEARDTLKVLRRMNLALFALGITILVVGLIASIVSQDAITRWTTFGTALGGFGAAITVFLKQPLRDIQDRTVDLAQIEAVFISFIRELDLNDAYIQSQYLMHGELSDDDISRTTTRIEAARRSCVEILEECTEVKIQDQCGDIDSLPPNSE